MNYYKVKLFDGTIAYGYSDQSLKVGDFIGNWAMVIEVLEKQ